MRLFHHAVLALFLAGAAAAQSSQTALAQNAAPSPAPMQMQPPAPSLTVDRDPVRSPEGGSPLRGNQSPLSPRVTGQGEGYVLRTDVDEVVLNCTVLHGNELVSGLKKEDFQVVEDGVPQKIISFQHTDLPVSFALVVDNSGSMASKRSAVDEAALDLIKASNPEDEAFVVNFSDEAFLDQDFTSNVDKLRRALGQIESRGGTALYDAVAASADELVADGKHSKQVLILITDGEDNDSTLDLNQAVGRVQQLSGPVIYSIGLLFGDEDMSRRQVKQARKALEMLSTETGGVAFFPKNLGQVDQIAAEVARDIRNQYMVGYHSTKPASEPGFRHVVVTAEARGTGKLTVRTRTGYFPAARVAKQAAAEMR